MKPFFIYRATGTAPYAIVRQGKAPDPIDDQAEVSLSEVAVETTPTHQAVFDAFAAEKGEDDSEGVGSEQPFFYNPGTGIVTRSSAVVHPIFTAITARANIARLKAIYAPYIRGDARVSVTTQQAVATYLNALDDYLAAGNWAAALPAVPTITTNSVRPIDLILDPTIRIAAGSGTISAAKLTGGTALPSTVTIGGQAAADVGAWSENPIERANNKSTPLAISKLATSGALATGLTIDGENLGDIKTWSFNPINRANVLGTQLSLTKLAQTGSLGAAVTVAGGDSLDLIRTRAADPLARAADVGTTLSAGKLTSGSTIPNGVLVNGLSVNDMRAYALDPIARANTGPTTPLKLDRMASGFGGNQIRDTDFLDLSHWFHTGTGGSHSETTMSVRGPGNWSGVNYNTLQMAQAGTSTDGYSEIRSRGVSVAGAQDNFDIPVKPGNYYEASAQFSMHRCTGNIYIFWRDSAGNFISAASAAISDGGSSVTNPDEWPRYFARGQAPANAAFAQFAVRKNGTLTSTNSYLMMHKPQLAETHANATDMVPFSRGRKAFLGAADLFDGGVSDAKLGTGIGAHKLTGALPTGLTVNGESLNDIETWAENPIARANNKSTPLALTKLAGTGALSTSITIDGENLGDIKTWSKNPIARANVESTLLNTSKFATTGAIPPAWTVNNVSLDTTRGYAADPLARAANVGTTLSLGKLASGLGGNLLKNTSFDDDFDCWRLAKSGGMSSETSLLLRTPGASYAGTTFPTLYMYQNGTSSDGVAEIRNCLTNDDGSTDERLTPVNEGEYYEASIQASLIRCTGTLYLYWRDKDGTGITGALSVALPTVGSSNNNPDAWPRYVIRGIAPAGAAYAQIFVRKSGSTSGSDSYLFIHKPQIAKVHAAATEAAPYSEGARRRLAGGMIGKGTLKSDRFDTTDFDGFTWRRGTATILPVETSGVPVGGLSRTRAFGTNGRYRKMFDGILHVWQELNLTYNQPYSLAATWTYGLPAGVSFAQAPFKFNVDIKTHSMAPDRSHLGQFFFGSATTTSVSIDLRRITGMTDFVSGNTVTVRLEAIGLWTTTDI